MGAVIRSFAGKGTEAAEALSALTTLHGGLETIAEARRRLPRNPRIGAALAKTVASALQSLRSKGLKACPT